ncbi:MAG: CCA tRNA nucleotidyltransferase [archaeon]|nr:CCA tRNA nucleotidyltransferase [archaeon]
MPIGRDKTRGIMQSVLEKIKPLPKEQENDQKFAEQIVQKIRGLEGKHIEVVLAGSVARNTHLKNDKDIDVFTLFPSNVNENELESHTSRIADHVFGKKKWEKAFSQHPYARGKIGEHVIEIVPGYKVENAENLKSAVDRSPLHAKYVVHKLSEKQKDEVRLLKQFLKGIQAYGAEIKTESVPGYVTELLIIHYGSFLEALAAASNWKKHEVIDIEKRLAENKASETFDSPLIIIDPVDKNRNVAAALSLNQMARFIAASREFLKKPGEHFFFSHKQKTLSAGEIKKRLEKEEPLVIETGYPNVVWDIAWGQLKRLSKKIQNEFEQKEFAVLRREVFTDEKNYMVLVFDLKANVLEKAMMRTGPEVFDGHNSDSFLSAHKKNLSGPMIENGRWVVEIERQEWDAKKFVQKTLEHSKKTEKEEIRKALKKKAKILSSKEILKKYSSDKKFAEFFSSFMRGKEVFL